MAFWALGMAGASAALSYKGDQRGGARRRHKMNWRRLQETTRRGFDRAETLQKNQLTTVQRGAKDARREIGRQETEAKRAARDYGVQRSAEAVSTATSRGLSSTTVADSMKRAADSDVVKRMGDVDAQIGEMYAGLSLDEAGAVASVYGGMANLAQARYAAEFQLEDINYNFWMAHEGFGPNAMGKGGMGGLNLGGIGAAAASAFGGFDFGGSTALAGGTADYPNLDVGG